MHIKINNRSVYAPIRYEATRPYSIPFGKLFISNFRQGEQQHTLFLNKLIDLLRVAVNKLGHVDGPGPVQSEIVNVQVFGHFQANGKIIFDVAKPLTQSLLLTDTEEIPCCELIFPTDSFYLHFGSGTGLLDDGLEIQGAFVTLLPKLLLVDLVPCTFGQAGFFSQPLGEPLIGISVDISDGTKTVAQALIDTINEVLLKNAQVFAEMDKLEAELTEQYGEVVKVPAPVEQLAGKGPLLKKGLSLVVNTLFYLSAEPDDSIESWGQDTPSEALSSLAVVEKQGTKKTIENTLIKAGYVKVRYVGGRFAASQEAREIGESVSTGRVLITHIRRGHFRRQAYGQERALRKTIFVAPVVVNARNGEEIPGRIYDVTPVKPQ